MARLFAGARAEGAMDKEEKSRQMVKSIKMLESVYKTTTSAAQRSRVKKDVETLRARLKELYPEANIKELEEAIYSDMLTLKSNGTGIDEDLEFLRGIEVVEYSPYKDDAEINTAASILKHFEERIWGVITDQHTKLDFSNSGERDTLYRKLDQCDRALKMFLQTVEDIDKAKSNDYASQLQMMRVKQGRVFQMELNEFLKKARDFVVNLVSDAEFGGTMILNPDDPIAYAEYETYRMFENVKVIDALRFMKNFLEETQKVIRMPDLGKMNK